MIKKLKNPDCICVAGELLHEGKVIPTDRPLPRPVKKFKVNDILWMSGPYYGAPGNGTVMELEKFKAFGGFDPHYYPAADFVFFTAYNLTHTIYKTYETLGYHRIGVNESLKINTVIDCYRERDFLWDSLSKTGLFTRVFISFFKNEMRQISYEDMSKSDMVSEGTREQFDSFCKPEKFNKIKLRFLRLSRKAFYKFKYIKSYLLYKV